MDLHVFFEHEVTPALGCTEPGAVAYAAAVAASRLEGAPRHIHLRLSQNICKNGQSVGIPGAGGLTGNMLAAALGALGGKPEQGLSALTGLDEGVIREAASMVREEKVTQEVVPEVPSVYVEVELLGRGESVTAVVAHRHDNLVEIRQGRKVVFSSGEGEVGAAIPAYLRDLGRMNFAEMWEAAESIDAALRKSMLDGATMNMAVAREGLAKPWGLGVGHHLSRVYGDESLVLSVKAHAAAAADVRMAGGEMPVMSSAGSGNHGLTAIVPPVVAARAWGKSDDELAEALALSHLVTGAVKVKTGRLTPVCGCAVAAGSGAAAALTRLAGGDARQSESAVAYVLAALMGMVCDGAKFACSLKVATASAEAFDAAMLAVHGAPLRTREGLVGPDFLDNARAVGELCGMGFAAVDGVIMRILGGTSGPLAEK
ncbi:UPF0597 protein yhaM [Alkalidesulfovibrio alkalitolerans DSM 16529]|jgi:L-cysteine desulfidase|uniref:UPF0597 protein dsat_1237 n=1 Tax=Alkalidesulfovibrio alkalitolerans DSM 16529 TaxID=1121439 RepID=S7T1X0_9BACT|nr:L-serine ammonia-lyase, iron-sulfur-dependent, subunit alpha [Alkalidesulfovibrio alkalitolerans]EPR30515.1 UPF0597 protein yhaM [Alkalidesulfovibrio alkalitolerans DSM 16529]